MTRKYLSFGQLLKEMQDLVFPVQCAGCGTWDINICRSCWQLAGQDPLLSAMDDSWGAPELPVWSVGQYDGRLRRLIIAAKHDDRRNVEDFLYHCGAALGQAVALNLEAGFSDFHRKGTIWIVPAPSSWKRRWDRREITGIVARGVADGVLASLSDSDPRFETDVKIVAAVGLRFRSGSQSSRNLTERRRARSGAMMLLKSPGPGTPVVIVDDVMTTGATLAEVCRCLGPNVQAAVVLARA